MNVAYRNILKATTLFGSVQGLSILLNIVRTKLAALILGPTGIGLNAIYNEMRELIHSTTNLGMDVSGVREVSLAYEEGDAARIENSIKLTRSWVLLLAIFGAFICFVLAEPLSWLTFSDFTHTWNFALLAPSVAFSTLACGEMAILKGVRRLKALASISVINVIAGIVTTIPVYYFWGIAGLVPALVLLTLSMYLIVISYSYREYPLHLDFKRKNLSKGYPMLVIGLSFMLSGMAAHGTELAIRTYINNIDSSYEVGLYSAGFSIVMTYGGILFASLDSDYYPRLSGVFSDLEKCKETMNKQIEVLLVLITPLIIIMILALPILVPLLYSNEFNEVIPMAQMASLGLLFRAVYLPAIYMPLAAGDSKSYLILEVVSGLVIIISVIAGYNTLGLLGSGLALTVSNLIDMIITHTFVRYKYGINITRRIVFYIIVSLLLICAVALLYLGLLYK